MTTPLQVLLFISCGRVNHTSTSYKYLNIQKVGDKPFEV